MKTPHFDLRLIFSGDTVLMILSILFFIGSLAEFTQWQEIQTFRFFSTFALLLSPVFLLLSCLELVRYRRLKRTFFSALFFLAATILSLYILIHATGHLHRNTI